MLLLGVWIGAIAGIVLFADFVGDGDGTAENLSAIGLVDERIRPIGLVALIGDADVDAIPAESLPPRSVRVPLSGPLAYNDICNICHAAPGIAGTPERGDMIVWAPRLAQGIEVIQDHVMNGYQGEIGFMPPKGGRLDFTDEEILAAIDFMLEPVR